MKHLTTVALILLVCLSAGNSPAAKLLFPKQTKQWKSFTVLAYDRCVLPYHFGQGGQEYVADAQKRLCFCAAKAYASNITVDEYRLIKTTNNITLLDDGVNKFYNYCAGGH